MKVKITKLSKNPMQSGLGKSNQWILTCLEENKTRSINDVTGWTSSDDTKTQLKIKFRSKEDAIAYAEEKGYEYVVDEANDSTLKSKSYADNFTAPIL